MPGRETALATLTEIRRVAKIMDVEVERDAQNLDLTRFDARSVGECFGTTLATVHSLAKMVDRLAEITEGLVTEVTR